MGSLGRAEILIILVALALRIGFVVSLPAREFIPSPDQLLHDSLARNFLAGRGISISEEVFRSPDDQPEWVKKKLALHRELGGLWGTIRPGVPQAAIPPLNALALALSYAILGTGNMLLYRLMMALLGAMTCWLAFDVANRLFGRRVALMTLILVAIHPALLYYTGVVLTETLFIFFFMAFVDTIIRFREQARLIHAILAGALWVLGLLTRSVMTCVLPVAVLLMLFPRRRVVKPLATLVFLLTIALCLVPWVVRNYQVFDRIVVIPTQGYNLWERNNYRFNERYQQETEEARGYAWLLGRPPFELSKPHTVEFPPLEPSDDEVTRNEKFYRQAREFILANPGLYARLCLARFFEFFRILGRTQGSLVFVTARLFPYGLTLPLFLVGFLLAFRRSEYVSRQKIVLILVILAYVALHVLVTAEPRYRLPIEPLMLAFASFAAISIYYRRGKGGKGEKEKGTKEKTEKEGDG